MRNVTKMSTILRMSFRKFFESRSSLKFCREPVDSGSILLQILRLVFRIGAAIIFCRVSERLYVADFSFHRPLVGAACARSGNGRAAQFLGYEMLTKRIQKKGSADRSLDHHDQRRHCSVNLDWQP
jgi:hypothetical protein